MVITGYFKFIQIQPRNTNSFHLKVSIRVLLKIHTVNPLLSPLGAYLFQVHLRRDLFESGGLFDLEMMMVSVLLKELGYKVEKLKYKKF